MASRMSEIYKWYKNIWYKKYIFWNGKYTERTLNPKYHSNFQYKKLKKATVKYKKRRILNSHL